MTSAVHLLRIGWIDLHAHDDSLCIFHEALFEVDVVEQSHAHADMNGQHSVHVAGVTRVDLIRELDREILPHRRRLAGIRGLNQTQHLLRRLRIPHRTHHHAARHCVPIDAKHVAVLKALLLQSLAAIFEKDVLPAVFDFL